jgi:hypothetical protein
MRFSEHVLLPEHLLSPDGHHPAFHLLPVQQVRGGREVIWNLVKWSFSVTYDLYLTAPRKMQLYSVCLFQLWAWYTPTNHLMYVWEINWMRVLCNLIINKFFFWGGGGKWGWGKWGGELKIFYLITLHICRTFDQDLNSMSRDFENGIVLEGTGSIVHACMHTPCNL